MYKKQMLVGVVSTCYMLTMQAHAQSTGTDYVGQCKAQLASYKADLEASQVEDQKEAFEAAVALEVAEQQKAKETIEPIEVALQSPNQIKQMVPPLDESSGSAISDIAQGGNKALKPSSQSALNTVEPAESVVVAAPEVTNIIFGFHQGRLKDQVETFLSIHAPEIQTFIWSADENLQWVNDFTAEGQTYQHILSRILKSYGLGAKKYGNDVIEILPRGALGK
jgi:hypothetical protein